MFKRLISSFRPKAANVTRAKQDNSRPQPPNARELFEHAQQRWAHNDMAGTAGYLAQALNLNPTDMECFGFAVELLCSQTDAEEIGTLFREVVQIYVRTPPAGAKHRPAPAMITALESKLTSAPNWTAGMLLAAAFHRYFGEPSKGLPFITQLLDRDPNHAEGWLVLGCIYLDNADYSQAFRALNQARALGSNRIDIITNVANGYCRLGHWVLALETLKEVESASLSEKIALCKARAYMGLKQFDEAEDLFYEVLSMFPENCEAFLGLAETAFQSGEASTAIEFAQRATECNPAMARAWMLLGTLRRSAGQIQSALATFEKAASTGDLSAQQYNEIGGLFHKQSHPEKAVEYYRKALDIEPELIAARSNLGLALRDLGRYSEALALLTETLKREPTDLATIANLALVYGGLGDYDNAMPLFHEYFTKKPKDLAFRSSFAMFLLSMGNFERGWDEYESRWSTPGAVPRPFNYPPWTKHGPRNQTVLVFGEQGLGDEIMFSSCIPDLLELHPNVVIECDKRLAALFSRSFPSCMVQGRTSFEDDSWLVPENPTVDAQVAIGSLPQHFRRSKESFPVRTSYLSASAERTAYWRSRLSTLPGSINVGISWRGGSRQTRAALRSLEIDQLAMLARTPNVNFINLQYNSTLDERQQFRESTSQELYHFQDAIDDYDETAALVTALDLVISVQTAVIHLCGALGVKTWVLLPVWPEWRYGHQADRMPWYSSVRLFRQTQPGVWSNAIEDVARRLTREYECNRSRS